MRTYRSSDELAAALRDARERIMSSSSSAHADVLLGSEFRIPIQVPPTDLPVVKVSHHAKTQIVLGGGGVSSLFFSLSASLL